MPFNLIVAMCRNNGIGYRGDIPWHIKHDLQNFSKLTKGHGHNAIVMGNNTWASLQRLNRHHNFGLPERDNLIFSHSQTFAEVVTTDNRLIKTFGSYEEFEPFIQTLAYDEVWIIGGAQVYQMFLEKKLIQNCYITSIDKDFECDTFFPALEPSEWTELEIKIDYDTKYECTVRYLIYEKTPIIVRRNYHSVSE